MSKHGVPPWHLWGSEQAVSVPASVGTANSSSSAQLARINYKRPDTWTFFFLARLLAGVPSGATQSAFVSFDLTLGAGRQSTTIQGFRVFSFVWTVNPPIGTQLYASTAPNAINVGSAAPVTDGFIETFPASEIQCTANVTIPASNGAVTMSVGCYFAPRSHVRPDWYAAPHPQFSGEEGGH